MQRQNYYATRVFPKVLQVEGSLRSSESTSLYLILNQTNQAYSFTYYLVINHFIVTPIFKPRSLKFLSFRLSD
jgi:hypothetical protein